MPATASVNPSSAPKRLLCMDGGGIRGIIEAEVLMEMESQLKQLTGGDRPLCEHFDLIGGTSTGQVFTPKFLVIQFWHKYPSKPLERRIGQAVAKEQVNMPSPAEVFAAQGT
jgi:patatin-like phospholipase/acyl hydrolase